MVSLRIAIRCRFVDTSLEFRCIRRMSQQQAHDPTSRFPPQDPGRSGSPASAVLSGCYDFLPPIPPHFVSFAWRYHGRIFCSLRAAQSHSFQARCLRFAVQVTPTPRKTRFRPLARLYRVGFSPTGSQGKVSATHPSSHPPFAGLTWRDPLFFLRPPNPRSRSPELLQPRSGFEQHIAP